MIHPHCFSAPLLHMPLGGSKNTKRDMNSIESHLPFLRMMIIGRKHTQYNTGNVQCNETLRGVRAIFAAAEKQCVLHILSVYF